MLAILATNTSPLLADHRSHTLTTVLLRTQPSSPSNTTLPPPVITMHLNFSTLLLATLALATSANAQACGSFFGSDSAACKAQCSDLGGTCFNRGGTAVLLLQCSC